MSEEGIDVTANRVKLVQSKMVDQADVVIVMCRKDQCPQYLIDSPKTKFWEIKDPYGLSIDALRQTRDQIKSEVIKLFSATASQHTHQG